MAYVVFNSDMDAAPWDKYVLLLVTSGMMKPDKEPVLCIRHSDGYHNGQWTTVQNNHLTESHTGAVLGWTHFSWSLT